MNLRLLHPALPVGIIKELKDCVKWLIRIVRNVGKPSALIVFEERITCDCHTRQSGLQFINIIEIGQTRFEPTIFTVTNIVTYIPKKARTILFRRPSHELKIKKTKASAILIKSLIVALSVGNDRGVAFGTIESGFSINSQNGHPKDPVAPRITLGN